MAPVTLSRASIFDTTDGWVKLELGEAQNKGWSIAKSFDKVVHKVGEVAPWMLPG